MSQTPTDLLRGWVEARADSAALDWYAGRLETSRRSNSDRDLAITFGMVPRTVGRADLSLTEEDLAAAERARAGWRPGDWSLDQALRILFLMEVGGQGDVFAGRLADLTRFAEIGEAIALYRGLPLYPSPERLTPVAAEGARTNMRGIFEAVAHHNPYPCERFDENRWNQMIVKAVFIGSSLAPIQGLDERSNEELAVMLTDTSKERRAAGRPVSFEVWRLIGPHANGEMIAEMRRELQDGDENGRSGAALGLFLAPGPEGKAALRTDGPDLARAIEDGRLTWESLSARAGPGLQQHFERTAS